MPNLVDLCVLMDAMVRFYEETASDLFALRGVDRHVGMILMQLLVRAAAEERGMVIEDALAILGAYCSASKLRRTLQVFVDRNLVTAKRKDSAIHYQATSNLIDIARAYARAGVRVVAPALDHLRQIGFNTIPK